MLLDVLPLSHPDRSQQVLVLNLLILGVFPVVELHLISVLPTVFFVSLSLYSIGAS